MILKLVIVPSLFVIAGLVLLGIAMLAPERSKPVPVSEQPTFYAAASPASERIRELERVSRGPDATEVLRRALDDPDPQVSAVAAILLRDCRT